MSWSRPVHYHFIVDPDCHRDMTESHISSNFSAIRARLSRMPPIHRSTLRVIVEHLSRVAANSTQNKMDAKVQAVYCTSDEFCS